MNKKRILFWGIQRSGNHAIINWILGQFSEPKMFLNHQEFGQELKASPTRSLATHSIGHGESPKFFYAQKGQKNWRKLWSNPPAGLNELILVSHENYDISQLSEQTYAAGCRLIDESVVGESLETINIVILRDAFNMWVSQLPSKGLHSPDLWKKYAKEFLGETNFLPNKICIDYNKWFADVYYRKCISEKLGVPFSDAGLNKVSKAGGGSNFDGTKFDGNAQQMNVLNRWEESRNFLKKRRLIRTFVRDQEMKMLVQRMYPDLYDRWGKFNLKNALFYLT